MSYDMTENTQDKLIILYLLTKMQSPLTLSQLTIAILEQEYCDYFTLQQNLTELNKASLIIKNMHNNISNYTVTPSGAQIANAHFQLLPPDILAELNQFVLDTSKEAKNILDITATYCKNNEKEHEYIVYCKITENDSILFELNLNVSTNNVANSICNNFKKNTNEIYSEILHLLTKG
ncbi:MAG: hypothetical protein ATN31_02255 [Candidatus Epulonipiscioides saccharophilum]|nr:MAG: hypothetical protein ATN31_02255 [Epulopiscium sp. AS2M-Bin001]